MHKAPVIPEVVTQNQIYYRTSEGTAFRLIRCVVTSGKLSVPNGKLMFFSFPFSFHLQIRKIVAVPEHFGVLPRRAFNNIAPCLPGTPNHFALNHLKSNEQDHRVLCFQETLLRCSHKFYKSLSLISLSKKF